MTKNFKLNLVFVVVLGESEGLQCLHPGKGWGGGGGVGGEGIFAGYVPLAHQTLIKPIIVYSVAIL